MLQPLKDVRFALPKKIRKRESPKSALTFTDLILTALTLATPALLCTAGQATALHEFFPQTQYPTDGQTTSGPLVLSAFFCRGEKHYQFANAYHPNPAEFRISARTNVNRELHYYSCMWCYNYARM